MLEKLTIKNQTTDRNCICQLEFVDFKSEHTDVVFVILRLRPAITT
jgi:hypothetical protein